MKRLWIAGRANIVLFYLHESRRATLCVAVAIAFGANAKNYNWFVSFVGTFVFVQQFICVSHPEWLLVSICLIHFIIIGIVIAIHQRRRFYSRLVLFAVFAFHAHKVQLISIVQLKIIPMSWQTRKIILPIVDSHVYRFHRNRFKSIWYTRLGKYNRKKPIYKYIYGVCLTLRQLWTNTKKIKRIHMHHFIGTRWR